MCYSQILYCVACNLFFSSYVCGADVRAPSTSHCSTIKTLFELSQEAVFAQEDLCNALGEYLEKNGSKGFIAYEPALAGKAQEIARPLYPAYAQAENQIILNGKIGNVVVARSGDIVISTHDALYVWDIKKRETKDIPGDYADWVFGIAVDQRNGDIVLGGKGGIMHVLYGDDYSYRAQLYGHHAFIETVAIGFNDDIISGSFDCTVRVWNREARRCKKVLSGHQDLICCVMVDPKKEIIISGSRDWTLRVWDACAYKHKATLKGHDDCVRCVMIDANGNIVSGSCDETVRIWSSNSCECIAVLHGHTDSVTCLAIHKNGDIVSGSHDATIRIWDRDYYFCKTIITGLKTPVNCLLFDNQENMLVGTDEGLLRVYYEKPIYSDVKQLSYKEVVQAAMLLQVQLAENRCSGSMHLSDKQRENILNIACNREWRNPH